MDSKPTKDGVHTDYRTIMDANTKKFPEMYEELITQYAEEFQLPPIIIERLREKRAFGLKKYGEHSFQSSFENSMTTPIYDHFYEEIIDSFNYLLHMRFVLGLTSPQDLPRLEWAVDALREAYFHVSQIQMRIPLDLEESKSEE